MQRQRIVPNKLSLVGMIRRLSDRLQKHFATSPKQRNSFRSSSSLRKDTGFLTSLFHVLVPDVSSPSFYDPSCSPSDSISLPQAQQHHFLDSNHHRQYSLHSLVDGGSTGSRSCVFNLKIVKSSLTFSSSSAEFAASNNVELKAVSSTLSDAIFWSLTS